MDFFFFLYMYIDIKIVKIGIIDKIISELLEKEMIFIGAILFRNFIIKSIEIVTLVSTKRRQELKKGILKNIRYKIPVITKIETKGLKIIVDIIDNGENPPK